MPLATTASQSPAGVQSASVNLNRRVAERIRRAIAPFKPDLMRPVSVREVREKVPCQLETAACVHIGHDFSARYASGIELIVPCRVERVGPVDPLAVTANLDHLRTAPTRLAVRVGRTTSNAADVDRACKLRCSWVGDIVLAHLTGS